MTSSSDEAFVCGVADALEADDEVLMNSRSRPITVLGRDVDTGGVVSGSDYPYREVWLRGNGTEYRLRYSHTGRYYPHLNSESELETTESFSVKHGEPRPFTRATTRGERVKSISVVGVDEENLSDWVLSRTIEVRA